MILRLILFVAVLAGFSWAGAWLLQHQGQVELLWLGYEVRTTVAFALACFITVLLLLLFMVQFVLWVFSLPERARQGRDARHMNRAMLALTKGFAAIGAADVKEARLASREAVKLLSGHKQGSQLALILSAEADQLEGNHVLAEEKFTALLAHKSTEFLGLKGLLVEAQKTGDIPKALEIAEKAYKARPEGRGIVRMLLTLYKRLGKWEDARKLLDAYSNRRRFSLADAPSEVDSARERAGVYVMLARQHEASEVKKAASYVQQALKAQPDFAPAVELGAQIAIALGQKNIARKLIEKQWRVQPTAKLGEMYLALSEGAKPKKHIHHALRLMNLNPTHVESLRVAAQAYLDAGEFTGARNQVKLALMHGEAASLCALMATIEITAGEGAEAERWHERAAHAWPDAGWECRECHAPARQWVPICPVCDAVDTVVWVARRAASGTTEAISSGTFIGLEKH